MVQTKIKNMNKRKRTENWTASDKSLLRKLCAESINTIENKCVDTDTNRRKRECWTQMTDAFNSFSETKRDVVQVQFQWRTMKMKAKTAASAYRKAISKTGGGPPPPSLSKEDLEIMELISNESRMDKNVFDSDEAALQIKDEQISEDLLDDFIEDFKDNEFQKDLRDHFTENNQSQEIIRDHFTENNQSQDNVSTNHSHLPSSITKYTKKKKIDHDSEASQKRELFELTKVHMIEEHEGRMAVIRAEQQIRQKELEKLELEMELLRK